VNKYGAVAYVNDGRN